MNQGGDVLARGGRSAQFAAGDNKGEIELKNVAPEGSREDFTPVEIDRTRHVKRITPKGDQILVQRREAENVSAGGILLAESAKDRPAEGVIVSIGPLVKDLNERDHILFGKYAGTEYPFGGETLLFMREEEVIAVVEE
ncbi:MAG: co-chaperone GroES [Bacteroidetes bacterium]|nr:MAG: co-chaperone GroES [Bacteroidota bacterium]